MRVTIFGSGYVGLVTGACLADAGNHVICVDVDAKKIERLNQGEVPIHEPGLDALIRKNAKAGRIEFTTDARKGVEHGLFQLIAVGTPPDEDGSADLEIRAGRRPHDRREPRQICRRHHQVDRARRHGRQGARRAHGAAGQAQDGRRVRRGLQPRVPEGRRRDQRLHEARSRGGRHRQPAHGRAAARACTNRSPAITTASS